MTADKPIRATMPLLKAPVTNITDGGFTIALGAQYGSPTTIKIKTDTRMFDLRDGDIVTIYTEVLLKPGAGNG